jgi:hypothetical protein
MKTPRKFLECKLYRGYFGTPNTWLMVTDKAHVGDEYKFFAVGGVPRDRNRRLESRGELLEFDEPS